MVKKGRFLSKFDRKGPTTNTNNLSNQTNNRGNTKNQTDLVEDGRKIGCIQGHVRISKANGYSLRPASHLQTQ